MQMSINRRMDKYVVAMKMRDLHLHTAEWMKLTNVM